MTESIRSVREDFPNQIYGGGKVPVGDKMALCPFDFSKEMDANLWKRMSAGTRQSDCI